MLISDRLQRIQEERARRVGGEPAGYSGQDFNANIERIRQERMDRINAVQDYEQAKKQPEAQKKTEKPSENPKNNHWWNKTVDFLKKYPSPVVYAKEKISEAGGVSGIAKGAKEFIAPSRGFSEEELKNAHPGVKETLSALSKYPANIAYGILDSASSLMFGPKEKSGAEVFGADVNPATAGEAKAMQFADVATLIPAGSLKALKGEQLFSAIAKSTNDDFIKSVLRGKISDEEIEGLSKVLKNVSNKEDVAKILSEATPLTAAEKRAATIKANKEALEKQQVDEFQKEIDAKAIKDQGLDAESLMQAEKEKTLISNEQLAKERNVESLKQDLAENPEMTQPLQEGGKVDGLLPGQKERGFIKHVEKEDIVPEEALKILDKGYTPESSKMIYAKAKTLVSDFPEIAEKTLASGRDDTITQAIRMNLLEKYSKEGNFNRAVDIIESEAKLATKKGREVQMYSMLNRMTPEGMGTFIQRQFDVVNELNPKLNLQLSESEYAKLYDGLKDIQKITDEYTKTFETAKLVKTYLDKIPSSLASKISTIQTMSQLLNPKTIIRNIGGNVIFGGVENISQTIATPIDKFMSLFTGKRTTALPSATEQLRGAIKGGKQGAKEAAAGVVIGPKTQFDLPQVNVFKGKILGGLEKTMGVSLRAADKAAYMAAFDDTIKGLAKTGKSTTQEALDIANYRGLYRTFQDENTTTRIFSGLKKVLNNVGIKGTNGETFGLGDFILKYPKTPANLLNRGVAYTPAGFVKTIFEAGKPLFGKPFNQEAFVNSFSRSLVGTTGLVGMGATLYQLGIITPGPSKDSDVRGFQKITGAGSYQINASGLKRFIMTGMNPEAAKIKDGDTLVSYDWAQPVALAVSVGANAAENANKEGKTLGEKTLSLADTTVGSLESGINTLQQQPLVSGVKQLFGGANLTESLKTTAKGAGASFVPTLLSQINQAIDNTTRESYDSSAVKQSYNMAVAKIPFLAKTLEPRKTVFGENQERYLDGTNSILNVFLNPAFVTKFKETTESELVLGIYEQSGETKQFPRVTGKTQTINGEKKKLTAAEYEDLQTFIGSTTKEIFGMIANDKAFQNLSPEERANELSNVMTDIGKLGKVKVLGDKGDFKTEEQIKKKISIKSLYNNTKELLAKGDMAGAKSAMANLSEGDIKMFKEVQSSEKSKQTEKAKEELRPKFEEVKSLIQEGRKEEANRILTTMTEEELRVFKLLKNSS